VQNCTSPVTVSTEGANQPQNGTVSDVAGNIASTSLSISLDKTLPEISASIEPLANAAGWNNTTVVVTFTCNDALSGIESCTDPVTLEVEGNNQVVTGIATDRAGNTNYTSVVVKIDKTQPDVSVFSTPDSNSAGWYNITPALVYTCSDALSGVATCPSAELIVSEGLSLSYSGEAFDVAGNSATASILLNIDKTAPVITEVVSPKANNNGWHNSDVTVSYDCTDALSGVASCSNEVIISTEGMAQTVSGSAVDIAENTASVTVSLNIDNPTCT